MPTLNEPLWLASPGNPDDVLESLTNDQYEKDKFMPYWAYQWPCASVLFEFLDKNASALMPQDSLVCELGCGLGIISTLLQSKNIRCIATDICPDACYYAGYNIQGYNSFASTVCLDWRKIPFSTSFDFIVGADILYEQRWIPTVLDFLDATLKAGGKAIFADPQRNWWPVFKQAALDRNYALEVVHSEKINDNKTHVELLCVTKYEP